MANTVINSSVFAFQQNQVRTALQPDSSVWFAVKDVCSILNLTWSGATLKSIPKEWQGMLSFNTPSGVQRLKTISEPAVYKLAFRSNKPEADAFTNWVASEVLPTIRKTGKYEAAPTPSLPEGSTMPPDASEYHRRMREDLSTVTRIVEKLCCDARFYLPQSGSWGRFELLQRIGGSSTRAVKSLYEAKDHLREANSLTLQLKRLDA